METSPILSSSAMNLEAIKLSQLRALTTIASCGNFSEAALQIGVSQSAVSHAIATLEADLGVVLLSRGRHGATLTPVGARVLQHAQSMLNQLELIGREANLAKGLQGGQVRIGAFRSAATHLLPSVLAEFQKRYPSISITIAEYRGDDGVEQSLREGRVDIGLTCMPTTPEFDAWELWQDEYIALFPPNAKLPDPITWADLAQYPIIMPPANDYCSILVCGHLNRLEQKLKAAYEIMEDSTMVSMVRQGLGATIMARLAAEPFPAEIQVRALPNPLKRPIRAAVLASALHPPAVYAFLETLRELALPRLTKSAQPVA